MLTRRSFTASLAAAAAAPRPFLRRSAQPRTAFYASVGRQLALYDVDGEAAILTRRGAVRLPSNVQYAWPHPSRRFLYVVSSSGFPGFAGENHFLTAWSIDASSGALKAYGPQRALPYRPIHVSVDGKGEYALVSYIEPSHVSVHRIEADGTLGALIEQAPDLDAGIYAHQLRTTPSNATALLATRGYNASASQPERPGALKVFAFKDGRLTKLSSIAPGGGFGFGPRHLDFHPALPFVYVSLERQNKLYVFKLQSDGTLAERPLFMKESLDNPKAAGAGQQAGTIHVHPNGRFVYQANRDGDAVEVGGRKIFMGGMNSIAVYAIDPETGEPNLIQNADTYGIQPRTFSLHPNGRMLVAANMMPLPARQAGNLTTLAAGLTVFRIGTDGKLDFVRKYDVDTGKETLFWSGMVNLAA